jgi:Txe/YoeB family toxin of Txe-Axe toxin-antitoxin module
MLNLFPVENLQSEIQLKKKAENIIYKLYSQPFSVMDKEEIIKYFLL